MTNAAFQATVHGFRTVPSRKVIQLVLEVPIEQQAEIARICDHGAWVAVARLTAPAQEAAPEARQSPTDPAGEPHKKHWDEILPSQQSGILCADPKFWRFLNEKWALAIQSTADAATHVRQYLKLNSRADITPRSPAAMAKWRELVVDYRLWERAVV